MLCEYKGNRNKIIQRRLTRRQTNNTRLPSLIVQLKSGLSCTAPCPSSGGAEAKTIPSAPHELATSRAENVRFRPCKEFLVVQDVKPHVIIILVERVIVGYLKMH